MLLIIAVHDSFSAEVYLVALDTILASEIMVLVHHMIYGMYGQRALGGGRWQYGMVVVRGAFPIPDPSSQS